MSELKRAVTQMFSNPRPAQSVKTFPAPNELMGLDSPGANFKPPEIPLSARLHAVGNNTAPVAETPAPVVAPIIAPAVTPRCHACGQVLPQPVVIAEPVVDPDAERTDLPPRSRQEIARLIAAGETEEARMKRIINDKMRWEWTQGR
jgi:hypothetical protein